ncbi:uracil-DNA glycosylase [Pseudothauera nasutitermitis]|uniref:Type-4 uracil-DNA glycosylase n=1 Tax=Pseudothauera nasutitermitis TaxID=2565930 RepID=A0A4S4B215_9RHOO|nr:uracil-DNA glycosylase [Pseudothauera nasutitermitis]THF66634.1 uracil-DNA glycosylase [Pseudothauera nasutitermitis]
MAGQRASVLRELGLGPLWRLRSRAAQEEQVADEAGSVVAAPAPACAEVPPRAMAPAPRTPEAVAAPRRESPIPRPAPQAPPATPPAEARPAVDPQRATRIATLDWEELEAEIRACRACRLCEKRRQAVPGVGDRRADWLFVGEGPGAEEDQRGEPFVGAAGKLLDNMLGAIGLKRGENVYIANAVKCRPPHNRTPEADEIAACLPFLERQIALLQPRLMIALGRPAAQALLDTEVKIGASRGRLFEHAGVPVVVTYHPAYLLRNQNDKAKAWEDLCYARRQMKAHGTGAADG